MVIKINLIYTIFKVASLNFSGDDGEPVHILRNAHGLCKEVATEKKKTCIKKIMTSLT